MCVLSGLSMISWGNFENLVSEKNLFSAPSLLTITWWEKLIKVKIIEAI